MRIAILFVGVVAILFLPGTSRGDESESNVPLREKVKGAQRELDQILKEYKQASDKYMKLISKVRPTLKSREKRKKLIVENDPSLMFAKRAFALTEQNPQTVVGVLSLRFVVGCGYTSLNKELIALKTAAFKHLEEKYIGEKWFGGFLPTIAVETFLYDVKPFLHRCLDKSPHREVRGQACIHLANKIFKARRFQERHEKTMSKQEEQEMIALFERCTKEFGDLPTARTTIAKAAERNLFEIRNLVVGKPAPKTVGEDMNGAALELGDFRGKVVMLVFWGDWCGPCRRMLPVEQSLVEKFKDRSFVLLGINSDSRDKAKKAIEREKITWSSWWDGGNSSGPIAAKWNVTAWPTTYILDHKGVIRFRYFSRTSEEQLEEVISQLVRDFSK